MTNIAILSKFMEIINRPTPKAHARRALDAKNAKKRENKEFHEYLGLL
jgi:hypothetical protein